ncbi:hypothetical protein [Streptomyces sp. NPDC058307]
MPHLKPGERGLSLHDKEPSGPWDRGRRNLDPADDEATVKLVP